MSLFFTYRVTMTLKYSVFDLRSWEVVWCCVIFILGCLGNISVLIVITNSKSVSRKSPFNIYILTLAVVDLLASVLVLPDYILRTNIYNPPSGHHGTLMCKFLIGGFIPFWLLEVSLYLLVVICLERRKAILNPFSTLNPPNLCRILLVILLLFFLGAFNQVPTLYGIYYNKENSTSGNFCAYKEDHTVALAFHFTSFTLQCLVPLVIFLISFYQIQRKLRDLEQELCLYNTTATVKQVSNTMKNKRGTIETLQVVVLMFFICILPNETVYMIFEFVSNAELEMNSPFFQVTVLLRFSNSCLNPLLYSYRSKEFRKRFKEVFKLNCVSPRLPGVGRDSGISNDCSSYSLLV